MDFDFASLKEIIKVMEDGEEKEVWTGDYIFDNEWQTIKVVDIFGNDTTRVIEIEV